MKKRAGFTLVELVVVVLILGVLAAIAAPRVLDTSVQANEASLRQSLTVLRDAVAKYRAQHGEWPAQGGNSNAFHTDVTPYLAGGRMPVGPLGPPKGDDRVRVKSDAVPLTGNASASRAWKYDNQTGELIYNYRGLSSDGVTQYDQF